MNIVRYACNQRKPINIPGPGSKVEYFIFGSNAAVVKSSIYYSTIRVVTGANLLSKCSLEATDKVGLDIRVDRSISCQQQFCAELQSFRLRLMLYVVARETGGECACATKV